LLLFRLLLLFGLDLQAPLQISGQHQLQLLLTHARCATVHTAAASVVQDATQQH
jgi:hypothetical protein